MVERIKVSEYQKRPLEEIELPDGTLWTLRQPLEEDYYRRQEVLEAHMKRVTVKGQEIADRAEERRKDAERFGSPDGDEEARALVEEESDEKTLPVELTLRYMQASVLAMFIVPEQAPKDILEKLPPDLMHYLLARVQEVLEGDAAKKRVRSETR